MMNLRGGVLLIGVAVGLVACSGDEQSPSGAVDATSDGSGGRSTDGSTATGGTSDDTGQGNSGGTDSAIYGATFESINEICDILVYAQGKRISECNGLPPANGPTPSTNCPDAIFSLGSNRATTVTEAWDCVEQWGELTCQEIHDGKLPACVNAGTRTIGEKCVNSVQCESSACSGRYGICGTCQAAGDGITCDEATGCLGTQMCEAGSCIATTPATVPFTAEPGQECEVNCSDGYVCAMNDALDTRICRPNLAAGEACYKLTDEKGETVPHICSEKDVDTVCGPAKSCLRLGTVGSACTVDEELSMHCEEGSGCNTEGICQEYGSPGTACLKGGRYSTPCGPGQDCGDGVCVTVLDYGEACTGLAGECLGNANCEGGICVPDPTLTLLNDSCGMP